MSCRRLQARKGGAKTAERDYGILCSHKDQGKVERAPSIAGRKLAICQSVSAAALHSRANAKIEVAAES